MITRRHEKLLSYLKPGRVYRRKDLLFISKGIDRDLFKLTRAGILEKVGRGLYHKPVISRFGSLPPQDEELIRSFLKNDPFLLYSWNQYNSLGLGLVQLYNCMIVYNRKKQGLVKLGGKTFIFCKPIQGFPDKLTSEFLLVDLINNLNEIEEDTSFVKLQIKDNLQQFDLKKLTWSANKFGKMTTKNFLKELLVNAHDCDHY